jgi:hypothetical protein
MTSDTEERRDGWECMINDIDNDNDDELDDNSDDNQNDW